MIANLWRGVRALGLFLRSRAFAVSMLSMVLAFVVFQIANRTNAVYVVDGESRNLVFCMEDRPVQLLEAAGVESSVAQAVKTSGVDGHFLQVNLEEEPQVEITADGQTRTCQVKRGITVGELLYREGITYDGNDLLTPAAEKPLEDGDEIQLKRVEYEEYSVEEEIPYETVHKNSSLLSVGTQRVLQAGENGTKQLTYVRRTVDGVREDVQLLGEQVTQQPTTETILIGSEIPVSPLDFDLNVDENGKPLEYARLLENQIATGYSARPGASTASGRAARAGHVAVNPKEIPYGSRLYIVSKDNSFVYGCAIAADTGIGLLNDVVDVDLFYDTYQESVLNGRRIVDIYVLE